MSGLEPKAFVADAALMSRRHTAAEGAAYTRWLATHHYENFPVVSWLLPKRLHQDFYNVYAFCRWADDLGDEIGDRAESLRLLTWWRAELERMYAGETWHPVFAALRETVLRHQLPAEPFADLITAFVQDQTKTRYANWAELLAYCRYSANPVGRLVLMLCGYRDAERFRLSDEICSGLQLANFWQDVALDWQKGRVYLPQELMIRHAVAETDIENRRFTPAFARMMREAVDYAREFFARGRLLAATLDARLALDIDLFRRGGLAILSKIEKQGWNVLGQRPRISKVERVWILLQGLCGWLRVRVA